MPRVPVVLVVDDEAPIREVIRRYLVAEGYQVVEAADGESALQQFEAHAPDVVVLDVMMPGIDGIEVPILVKAASVVTPEVVARLVAAPEKHRKLVARVAVGDLITLPAQGVLRDAGWGWLDRRVLTTRPSPDGPSPARPWPVPPPSPIPSAARRWAIPAPV